MPIHSCWGHPNKFPCLRRPCHAALDGYATARPEGMGYGDLRSVSAQAIKAGR